ncbi:unnamed protein product [Polarella glacialis]|uniref:HMG box domain-containing protein n=1 Tax=Polarella glacialis TaxID=89957 RepID=A0A813G4D3_POLGL|nr:unnamed protein product [Polarella glacialis]
MSDNETPEKSKPRRAKSAYSFFCDEERAAASTASRARHDGKLMLAELGRELGQRWANMDAEARAKYDELAAQHKEEHEVAMREYVQATDPVAALRARYADLIPKRPLSAYFLFLQDPEQRVTAAASLKEQGLTQAAASMGSKLGQMWRELAADLKAPFVARAEATSAEHAEATRKWQDTSEFGELERCRKKRRSSRGPGERAAVGSHSAKPDETGEGKKPSSPKKGKGLPDASQLVTPPRQAPRTVRRRPLTTMDIDAKVLEEAQHLSLEGPLMELAGCQEVLEQRIYAQEAVGARLLLDALRNAGGAVDEARKRLEPVIVII